jgi:hypothetical protein
MTLMTNIQVEVLAKAESLVVCVDILNPSVKELMQAERRIVRHADDSGLRNKTY